MTDLQKLEYIHFVLQEAQTEYFEQNGEYNPDIENAIYLLEDIREPYFSNIEENV